MVSLGWLVGYGHGRFVCRKCREQFSVLPQTNLSGLKMLLHFRHSRHPWRLSKLGRLFYKGARRVKHRKCFINVLIYRPTLIVKFDGWESVTEVEFPFETRRKYIHVGSRSTSCRSKVSKGNPTSITWLGGSSNPFVGG